MKAGLVLIMAVAASAQVTFKDAFPGLKFNRVVCIAEMPGQAQKTYAVLEQHLGQLNIVQQKDGAWTKQTMLKITVPTGNETGLLGIAFHPDYKNNRRYFIYYNTTGSLKDVVEEREADATFIKDAGKCPVLGDPWQRGARHHPRPADHVVIEDGQQADRAICFVDFTVQRGPVIGLLVPTKPLAPARRGVLLPGSEDPP